MDRASQGVRVSAIAGLSIDLKFLGFRFAYIEFLDKSAVPNALELNETILKGRALKITQKRTNLPGATRYFFSVALTQPPNSTLPSSEDEAVAAVAVDICLIMHLNQ